MDYIEIAEKLGLDMGKDRKAAEKLDSYVKSTPDLGFLEGRAAIVFGTGPSLRRDLEYVAPEDLEGIIIIAADGAAKALLEKNIVPDIIVSDLDGDWEAIKKAHDQGSVLVIHAHADNIDKIEKYVPELTVFVATTQTTSFSHLKNFGGFMDGDRAVYLAEHFKADPIGLMGMDLGDRIGEYSGSRDEEFTRKKLRIAKRLLEELAEKTPAEIVNMTSGGEDIQGIRKASFEEFRVRV